MCNLIIYWLCILTKSLSRFLFPSLFSFICQVIWLFALFLLLGLIASDLWVVNLRKLKGLLISLYMLFGGQFCLKEIVHPKIQMLAFTHLMSLQTRITDFLVHNTHTHTYKHKPFWWTLTSIVMITTTKCYELVCLYVHIVFQLHYAVKLIIRTVMQLKLVTD